MALVFAELLGSEQLRGLAEMASKQRDLPDLGVLRAGGRVTDLHVFRHAAEKGCHGIS